MNALGYARLAQAAYSSKPTYGDPDSAARAVLGHTDDGIVISIPGTNNIRCILADIDVEVVQINGLGGLHKGFHDAATQLHDYLVALKPDVLVGHSEGASVALTSAGKLCLAGHPPKAVFAFEPAKISIDEKIGQVLKAHGVQILLTRNGNDPVTEIPITLPFLNWQHPGPLKIIGFAGDVINIEDDINDHMIENVIDSLTPFGISGLRG